MEGQIVWVLLKIELRQDVEYAAVNFKLKVDLTKSTMFTFVPGFHAQLHAGFMLNFVPGFMLNFVLTFCPEVDEKHLPWKIFYVVITECMTSPQVE